MKNNPRMIRVSPEFFKALQHAKIEMGCNSVVELTDQLAKSELFNSIQKRKARRSDDPFDYF